MSEHTTDLTTPPARRQPGASPLGYLIFLSRWLQVPLYLGLIVAQAVYVWQFVKELWHLVGYTVLGDSSHLPPDYAEMSSEAQTMLFVLGLVDVVMISNLLIMVIIGGYETFVSRIRLNDHPDQPEWLSHVNANVLKTKLAMSIIGISSIHLLRTFINSESMESSTMMWQTLIHLAFILSAMALAWIDKMSLTQAERAAHARTVAEPTVPASAAGAAGGATDDSGPTEPARERIDA